MKEGFWSQDKKKQQHGSRRLEFIFIKHLVHYPKKEIKKVLFEEGCGNGHLMKCTNDNSLSLLDVTRKVCFINTIALYVHLRLITRKKHSVTYLTRLIHPHMQSVQTHETILATRHLHKQVKSS